MRARALCSDAFALLGCRVARTSRAHAVRAPSNFPRIFIVSNQRASAARATTRSLDRYGRIFRAEHTHIHYGVNSLSTLSQKKKPKNKNGADIMRVAFYGQRASFDGVSVCVALCVSVCETATARTKLVPSTL